MVPAIAVPSDEPRFDTQRDVQEIWLCWSSGKADWTTFTEGVSITPRPNPMSSSPGKGPFAWGVLDDQDQKDDTGDGGRKPGEDQVRCWNRFASAPAASEDTKMPKVAAVKITPVLTAL